MNKLIALTVVLLIIIFLFVYISSQKSLTLFSVSSHSGSTTPTPKIQNSTVKNTIVNLGITKKKLTGGPGALQVTQGAMVILRITSDETGMFDLPGYDQHVPLLRNETVTLSFLASRTGHFEYDLSDNKITLGAIDVYPQ